MCDHRTRAQPIRPGLEPLRAGREVWRQDRDAIGQATQALRGLSDARDRAAPGMRAERNQFAEVAVTVAVHRKRGECDPRNHPARCDAHAPNHPAGSARKPARCNTTSRRLAACRPSRQLSNNASSSSCSCRTFSNICSRSGTSSPLRASPDTSSTTCPWCSITVRSP